MEQKELISEIIDLYSENARLKNELDKKSVQVVPNGYGLSKEWEE